MEYLKCGVMLALLVAAFSARAEKKIELQDIEEDNLNSEKKIELTELSISPSGPAKSQQSVNILTNDFFHYLGKPHGPSQPKIVHQYAVNEPVEKLPVSTPVKAPPSAPQAPPAPQPAMVGYLSNLPMEIYFVPQYTQRPHEQFCTPTYDQENHVPRYVMQPGKPILLSESPVAPQPPQQVTYALQPANTVATVGVRTDPPDTPSPYLYHLPLVHYQDGIPTRHVPKWQNPGSQIRMEMNTDTTHDASIENEVESPPDAIKAKPTIPQPQRHIPQSSYQQNVFTGLPASSPLLLRGHTFPISKALPLFRPLPKMYSGLATNAIPTGPGYDKSLKRQPASLLDSYVPSRNQLEYLRMRGFGKDPLSAYEALLSARNLYRGSVMPRHMERGFLPNQMFQTSGGVVYGHYRRSPKEQPFAARQF